MLTFTDARIHTCTHLHGCTHPHALTHAHTYTDAHIRYVYTHEGTHSRPHTVCTSMRTLTCLCTHTLPSPGQRAGLGQTAVDRSGHCSLWFPTGAAFLTGGQGEPRDSSGSSALALKPSTCSHACAIVRRSEGPPDALLSSLPQRGPPSATFPHLGHARFCSSSHSGRPGPMSPQPHGPSELPGFHRVLQAHRAFVRETDKETGLAAAHGRRRRGDSADLVVLCGPLRIWTAGHGHGRPPPSPLPFPCTSEAGQVRPPRLQACGAARHGRVTGSDPLGKDTGILRAELARPLREPEPVALTLTLRLPGVGAGHAGCFELCRADRPAGSPGGHLCYTLQGKPLCS